MQCHSATGSPGETLSGTEDRDHRFVEKAAVRKNELPKTHFARRRQTSRVAFAFTLCACGPERRKTATPALPGAVEIAKMVSISRCNTTGYVFMESKKSELVLVCLSLPSRNSIASVVSHGVEDPPKHEHLGQIALVDQKLLLPGSGLQNVHRRVNPACRPLCGQELISELPVPLNSSKITSSIRDPVSISAVAMMVRDPPSSMFLAAPKNPLRALGARWHPHHR